MKQSENKKNDKKRQWGGNNNNTGAKDRAESDITREGGQPSATPSPDTNRSQRSSSISHNPVFPSQLCPIEIISFQNKEVIENKETSRVTFNCPTDLVLQGARLIHLLCNHITCMDRNK